MSSLSWRIKVTRNNKSQRTLTSPSSGTGATVVRATHSLGVPRLFAKGESEKMMAMLGAPTDNYDLMEALTYNSYYPLWLCAPPLQGSRACAGILADGVKAFGDGLSILSDPTDSLESVAFCHSFTIPDKTLDTSFKLMSNSTTTDVIGFDSTSLNMSTGETSVPIGFKIVYKAITTSTEGVSSSKLYTLDLSFTAGTTSNLFTWDAGASRTLSGSFDTSSGTFTITKNSTFAYTSSNCYLVYTYNVSKIENMYGIIATNGCADENFVEAYVAKNDHSDASKYSHTYTSFKLYYKYLSDGKWVSGSDSPLEFSNDKTVVDAYGNSLNPSIVFADHDFLTVYPNYSSTKPAISAYTGDSDTYVELSGGGFDKADTDLGGGWTTFRDSNIYQFDLMFDATCDDNAITEMCTVRTGNYQPYARVLVPISRATGGATGVISNKPSQSDGGISLYYGYFTMSNPYSNTGNVEWIPMGDVAKRHADAIYYSYGGLATAWVDENGVGGQLTSGRILKSLQSFSETDLQSLDEARVNMIVYDNTFGPMIVSRRTTVMDDSDYSFNDYTGTFDYIIKNVVQNLLPYQLVKFNDDDHRRSVKNRIESLIQPLTVAPYNVLNDYIVKCDEENNDATARDNQEFHVDVAVQVTAKSRYIFFTFTNTSQTVSVSEAIG